MYIIKILNRDLGLLNILNSGHKAITAADNGKFLVVTTELGPDGNRVDSRIITEQQLDAEFSDRISLTASPNVMKINKSATRR
jgi:hypothetical protein